MLNTFLPFPLLVVFAIVLDLLIGDPYNPLHPARLIGLAANKLANPVRKYFSDERIAGIVLVAITVGGTLVITQALLTICHLISPILHDLVAIVIMYFALSTRDLCAHSMRVWNALKYGNVAEARKAVGMIVGRDTNTLNKAGVTRATIETVAENAVDGVMSPLFFMILFGPVGAMTYKAVNTMDSTFGYKTPELRDFGWASARLDDVANWLPARLSVPCFMIAAYLMKMRPDDVLSCVLSDANKHVSPNAGLPEAAVAGALHIQLGGPTTYFGKTSYKATLGQNKVKVAAHHIMETNILMLIASGVFAAAGLSIILLAFHT